MLLGASSMSPDSSIPVSRSDMYGLDVGIFVKCEEVKERQVYMYDKLCCWFSL